MLVTRKINVFSFFLGKPQARNFSKARQLNNTAISDLDQKISITRSEDFYKAKALDVLNPLSRLNR